LLQHTLRSMVLVVVISPFSYGGFPSPSCGGACLAVRVFWCLVCGNDRLCSMSSNMFRFFYPRFFLVLFPPHVAEAALFFKQNLFVFAFYFAFPTCPFENPAILNSFLFFFPRNSFLTYLKGFYSLFLHGTFVSFFLSDSPTESPALLTPALALSLSLRIPYLRECLRPLQHFHRIVSPSVIEKAGF